MIWLLVTMGILIILIGHGYVNTFEHNMLSQIYLDEMNRLDHLFMQCYEDMPPGLRIQYLKAIGVMPRIKKTWLTKQPFFDVKELKMKINELRHLQQYLQKMYL